MRTFSKVLGTALVLVVFLIFIFFYERVFVVLFEARSFVSSFFDRSFSFQLFRRMELENKILREEVMRLRRLKQVESRFRELGERTAQVYSNYPFNDKNLLIIDFGARDGSKVGMPVFANSGSEVVLVGQIVGVREIQSEVRTIFDSVWVSGATVGEDGARAVLRGGVPPRLELVPQEAEVESGDIVFNTSPEFPLKSLVAVVSQADRGTGRFWSRIIVKPLFVRDDLREVIVVTDFP